MLMSAKLRNFFNNFFLNVAKECHASYMITNV